MHVALRPRTLLARRIHEVSRWCFDFESAMLDVLKSWFLKALQRWYVVDILALTLNDLITLKHYKMDVARYN